MSLEEEDPVVLPKDQGRRAMRWLLGFGGWMACSVSALLYFGTNVRTADNVIVASLPAALLGAGVLAIWGNRRWRKAGDDDF